MTWLSGLGVTSARDARARSQNQGKLIARAHPRLAQFRSFFSRLLPLFFFNVAQSIRLLPPYILMKTHEAGFVPVYALAAVFENFIYV